MQSLNFPFFFFATDSGEITDAFPLRTGETASQPRSLAISLSMKLSFFFDIGLFFRRFLLGFFPFFHLSVKPCSIQAMTVSGAPISLQYSMFFLSDVGISLADDVRKELLYCLTFSGSGSLPGLGGFSRLFLLLPGGFACCCSPQAPPSSLVCGRDHVTSAFRESFPSINWPRCPAYSEGGLGI